MSRNRLVDRCTENAQPPRDCRPATEADIVPPDLSGALAAAGARQAFDNLGPGQQREYVAWIEEAKRPDTRARRIATAVAQASEGKSLHWVYRKG